MFNKHSYRLEEPASTLRELQASTVSQDQQTENKAASHPFIMADGGLNSEL